MLLLGAHVSTSGGVQQAPLNGEALGCTAIQLFTKNQRQWAAPPLSDEAIVHYFENLKKSSIQSVVAHDTYLINMASPDPEMRKKSTLAFIDEIKRADSLKLQGLVFHPGSHLGAGEAKGISLLAQSLDEVCRSTPNSRLKILIETTAGQGTNLGSRFEHLRDMLGAVRNSARFGICADTCHMFTAGYSIADKDHYSDTMKRLDSLIGLDRLGCFHLNDSKQPFGSNKDRHENIGNGFIGKAGFGLLLNDDRFETVPKILETPGGDEWYARDLKLLRGLIKKKA